MKGKIRIGIISSAREEVGSALVRYFRKYMPQFDAAFEWGTDDGGDLEKVSSKLVSTKSDVLILSSKAENIWRNIEKLRKNPLFNLKIVLLADDTTADEVTSLSALADTVFFKHDDYVVLCAKIEQLCDKDFFRDKERIATRLELIAEDVLTECFFKRTSSGCAYFKSAMVLCCYNPEYMEFLSALYYAVEHDLSAASEKTVEKCMRSAVHQAEKKYLEYKENGESRASLSFVNTALCDLIFDNNKVTVGKVLPILVDELMKRIEGKRVNDENSCA